LRSVTLKTTLNQEPNNGPLCMTPRCSHSNSVRRTASGEKSVTTFSPDCLKQYSDFLMPGDVTAAAASAALQAGWLSSSLWMDAAA
jgi:hypothetical protein